MRHDTYWAKKKFTEGTLAHCLREADPRIKTVTYALEDTQHEVITVRFLDGYFAKIDVTGDDLSVLLREVIAGLAVLA